MLLQENDLELLPCAAAALRGAAVSAINNAARTLLPGLVCGQALPSALVSALQADHGAGSFALEGARVHFLCLTAGDDRLILFRPAGEEDLTDEQLELFFRQMRGFMGEEFNRLQLEGPSAPSRSGREFHRALRTVNDLEFLRIPMEQAQALFQPSTMDLAGLCIGTCRQAAPMLRPLGTELAYTGSCTGLLIPGDPELLQRLLLCLISHAGLCAPKGRLSLSVTPRFDRAVVTLSGIGTACAENSSLSLDVARRIAALHGGTLLFSGTDYILSLPAGPISPSAPLKTPKMEQNGGISPFLLELSELLPESFFEEEPQ